MNVGGQEFQPSCTDCNCAEVDNQGSELKLNGKQKSENRKKVAGLKARAREMGVGRQIDDHKRFAQEFGLPEGKVEVRLRVCQTLLRLLGNRIEVGHW